MNILLVEDDLELGNGLRLALTNNGLHVHWARHLAVANDMMHDNLFDIVLLDVGLPDGDGITFLKRLRADQNKVPVLVLTARDALHDRVAGLDGGADDYVTKPFELVELLSRIRALARRSFGIEGDRIELRGLEMNEATRRATVDGSLVELSRSEFALLWALAKRADRVVTRRVLEDQVLHQGMTSEASSLDVHMSNLRRKIGEGYIRTVRGVGYIIDRVVRG
jgi:two-component system, OmpR family, response regulator QseB